MLDKILSKEECAACRFCCSFRRSSLWETPVIEPYLMPRLRALCPEAKFKPVEYPAPQGTMTVDLSGLYRTDDPEEEALCWFNRTGCILGDDKPFDCKIWPLYVMRREGRLAITLAPSCRVIAGRRSEVQELVGNGLGREIFDYVALHPEFVHDYHEGFPVLMEQEQEGEMSK